MAEMAEPADQLERHGRALARFGERVHAIDAGDWHRPTPCTDWDVRRLVAHLVDEQLWVPGLLRGGTVAEVAATIPDDAVGEDPPGAWDRAAELARSSFAEPGALGRIVHLSYGDRPADGYLAEMTTDLVIHTWDLSRAIDADEHIDEDVARWVYEETEPHADELAASGLFAPRLATPEDANLQTRLLALFGRAG